MSFWKMYPLNHMQIMLGGGGLSRALIIVATV